MTDIIEGSQVVVEETGAQGTVEAVQDWTPQGGNVIALVDFRDDGKYWVEAATLRLARPEEVPL